MSDVPSRLAAPLADRYRLERELGAGSMATVYLLRGNQAPSTFVAVHHFFDRLAFDSRHRP